MSRDDAGRFCAVCGRVLEEVVSGGQRYYRHAAVDEPADHIPVAVREVDAPQQLRIRCDYCLSEPVTHTVVLDKELEMYSRPVRWSTDWAMCRPCADLLMDGQWHKLRQRAFDNLEEKTGRPPSEDVKYEFRLIFREMKRSVVMVYLEP